MNQEEKEEYQEKMGSPDMEYLQYQSEQVEKIYCDCVFSVVNKLYEDMRNHYHKCPICHKQDYGTWWASEMNKKK